MILMINFSCCFIEREGIIFSTFKRPLRSLRTIVYFFQILSYLCPIVSEYSTSIRHSKTGFRQPFSLPNEIIDQKSEWKKRRRLKKFVLVKKNGEKNTVFSL